MLSFTEALTFQKAIFREIQQFTGLLSNKMNIPKK